MIVDNDCEDQGFSLISEGCFNCLPTFKDGKPVRQQLVQVEKYGKLWWECPSCHGSYGEVHMEDLAEPIPEQWTLQQGVELCTVINDLPSQKFNCHVALTGGLLYKTGLRKDCDIVIYQRGDTDGKREPINWPGLLEALREIGLVVVNDFGYVKKCSYQDKVVDVLDPTQDGHEYGSEKRDFSVF